MKNVLAFMCLFFVFGCTSLPRNAPPYSPATLAKDDSGILYIYRLGAYPILRAPTILVNQEKIIKPPEKAYTWVYLSPGTHKMTIDWAWDTGWPDLELEVPIESGKEHFVKITGSFEALGLTHHMGTEALFIEKTVAEQELRDCCKYMQPKNK